MADLLRCELVEVDGRAYRSYASASGPSQRTRQAGSRQRQQRYDDEDEFAAGEQERWGGAWDGQPSGGGWVDEAVEEESSVPIAQEGDTFVARMRLDAELFPFLIGKGGATMKRVELDTGAQIAFPSRTAQARPGASSAVVVKGSNRSAVSRACTQLELLVGQALVGRGPRSLDYNYFLSLPLANPQTSAALQAFRDAVLADPGAAAAGLEASVFMHPQHLHLTICMLKLYSDERRALARSTLHALAPRLAELLGGAPLEVQLKGLEYMTDDPSAMHVMYLDVQDVPGSSGSLQRLKQLCSAVVGAFGEAGLLLPQDERDVKLHATVINTRYRRRAGGTGSSDAARQAAGQQPGGQQQQQQRQQRQPFDGRDLLQKHGDVELGTLRLPAIHLSQRGKYDDATGFYHCADSLPLP